MTEDGRKEEMLGGKVEKRKGANYIFAEPEDEDMAIVAMIERAGEIYVATKKGIYVVEDEKLKRLKLELKE